MLHPNDQNDASGIRGSDLLHGPKAQPFTENRPLSASVARALYERELAYYQADLEYLPVDKAAERCQTLSLLLTAATFARDHRS